MDDSESSLTRYFSFGDCHDSANARGRASGGISTAPSDQPAQRRSMCLFHVDVAVVVFIRSDVAAVRRYAREQALGAWYRQYLGIQSDICLR